MFGELTYLLQCGLDLIHVHWSWSNSRVFLCLVSVADILEDSINILKDVIYDGVIPVNSQFQIIQRLLVSVLPQQFLVFHRKPVQVVFSLVNGRYRIFLVRFKCVNNFLEMQSFLQLLFTFFVHD